MSSRMPGRPDSENPIILNAHQYGVGGSEFVFEKSVARVEVGRLVATPMRIEVGALDYGFELDGIPGMDFLLARKARIDFARLEILGPITPRPA